MIIVHPDEITWLAIACDGLGVAFVDRLVSLPERRLEVTEVLQVMKQRPDDLVGVAVIKFVAFGFTQTHRHNLVAGVSRGFDERLLWDFTCNSRPADPGSAALAQHRFDRGD